LGAHHSCGYLTHGTTQHGYGEVCGGCCYASADHKHLHISFAVQTTPYQSLHKINKFSQETHMGIIQRGKVDMDSINWVYAEIIRVTQMPSITTRASL
jgi:hypothetical protein